MSILSAIALSQRIKRLVAEAVETFVESAERNVFHAQVWFPAISPRPKHSARILARGLAGVISILSPLDFHALYLEIRRSEKYLTDLSAC
ncbi:hypothetical protein RMSM_04166 [Rhodopirellula maiorica SM1]|uniref:Uncharacterized protein n=1 Tax=Rhodopirellula maiorica SM1 TaxID=1265738 RepID=M5RYA2_9BACT|nr:hypothetical protein RMSM_04166 [Rhodopirellula maiorica SM1]